MTERAHRLTRYPHMPRAGHFAAHGEPGLPAGDITTPFRELRPHHRASRPGA